MRILYTFGIRLYKTLIGFASLFNSKAKKISEAQKGLLQKIKSEVEPGHIIWFHVSSVGEFEQAIPIIEKIKENDPFKKILVSFFSPSGYELRKNYKLAEYVFYLPFDTPKNVKQFLEIVKPEQVFFVKYEFWFNYIYQIRNLGIPLYLVSGIFRPSQHFFKPYGSWFAKHLKMFTHLFIQDSVSASLLKKIGVNNYTVSGDTRFDRVYQNTLNPLQFDDIANFSEGNKVLLLGSSWPDDEKLIAEYNLLNNKEIKIIIAPHEINEEHLQKIEKLFTTSKIKRWSKISSSDKLQDINVILVDSIGKLMHLYQYADVAYVGGGFGAGIHNILEAACFGKPIVYGPNYHKFKEARDLIELKGAFSVSNFDDLEKILNKLLFNNDFLERSSNQCIQYVNSNIGSSTKVYEYCFNSIK